MTIIYSSNKHSGTVFGKGVLLAKGGVFYCFKLDGKCIFVLFFVVVAFLERSTFGEGWSVLVLYA